MVPTELPLPLWEWQNAHPLSFVARKGNPPGFYGRLDKDGWFHTIVTNVRPMAKQSYVIHHWVGPSDCYVRGDAREEANVCGTHTVSSHPERPRARALTRISRLVRLHSTRQERHDGAWIVSWVVDSYVLIWLYRADPPADWECSPMAGWRSFGTRAA